MGFAVAVTETNMWAMHRDFARVPGAEIHDEPTVLWYTLPSANSWLNGASRTSFRPDACDAEIRRVVDAIHARQRNVLWHVGPLTQPADLAARLEAAGFEGSEATAMALDIPEMRRPARGPHIDVEAVRSSAALLEWLHAFDVAFEITPRGESHPWYEAFGCLGVDEAAPTELFVARLDGEPVACALAFAGGGAVGVYGVGTVPGQRGRGFGSAVTAACIEWGERRGERIAILHATEMGEPVYRRMGFRAVARKSQWLLPAPA